MAASASMLSPSSAIGDAKMVAAEYSRARNLAKKVIIKLDELK